MFYLKGHNLDTGLENINYTSTADSLDEAREKGIQACALFGHREVVRVYDGSYQETPAYVVYHCKMYKYADEQLIPDADRRIRHIYRVLSGMAGVYQDGGKIPVHCIRLSGIQEGLYSISGDYGKMSTCYRVADLIKADGDLLVAGYAANVINNRVSVYGSVNRVEYANPHHIYKGLSGTYFVSDCDDGSVDILIYAF